MTVLGRAEIAGLPRSAVAVPRAVLRALRLPHPPATETPRLGDDERLVVDMLDGGRLHTRADFLAAERIARRNELHHLSRRAAAARRALARRRR